MKRLRRRRISLALALVLGVVVVAPVAAQTTIGAGGGSLVQSWGKDNTQTYGQTITAPTDNVLDWFSFWLGPTSTNFPDPANPSLTFRAYVYAWDAALSHAAGSPLFTSGPLTYNATPSTPFTEQVFSTGGLALMSGDPYVLFLSTSGLSGTGRVQWEAAPTDEYAGGSFVFQNNGEDQSQWTTAPWAAGYASDVHFAAEFSGPTGVVPEPSTWALLATGLLSVLFLAWRRTRREESV